MKLKEKLSTIDLFRLEASDYFKSYLKSYLQDLDSVLHRYVCILCETTRCKDLSSIHFLDFGGGIGVLALLAKMSDVPLVCYMDISREMRDGAKQLAELLQIQIDEYFVGSYEHIERACNYRFDIIANYDVLEHVYDPFEAFLQLRKILRENGSIFMASGANFCNPIINCLYRKKHKISERVGTINGKEMDSKKPFLTIRKEIIHEHFQNLEKSEVQSLAVSTRGLRKNDIIRAVHEYLDTGLMPKPEHKTNTCDPITGNWDEHLIDFYKLSRQLDEYFDEVELDVGCYPVTKPKFLRSPEIKDENMIKSLYPYLRFASKFMAPIVNLLINILPHKGKFLLSPYYFIHAKKRSTDGK